MVTRGFTGRGSGDQSDRIPPGQHLVEDFPVLVGRPYAEGRALRLEIHSQNWSEARQNVELGEFNTLPKTQVTKDIHCVTSRSKLDTVWEGVLIEDILADAEL